VAEFPRAVEEDWAELGVMVPGHLPRAWRTARLLYTVTHPLSGLVGDAGRRRVDRRGQGRAGGASCRGRGDRRRPRAAARPGPGWPPCRSPVGCAPRSWTTAPPRTASCTAAGTRAATCTRSVGWDAGHLAGTEQLTADSGAPTNRRSPGWWAPPDRTSTRNRPRRPQARGRRRGGTRPHRRNPCLGHTSRRYGAATTSVTGSARRSHCRRAGVPSC